MSSDTPLTDRIFDPRHLPSTIVQGDGTVDLEYNGGYFVPIGTFWDNIYWEMDYNFFSDTLTWDAPAGCYQDGNGFYDMQVKNFASWGGQGDADIEVWGIETQNNSPYEDGLVLYLDVADNINFTGAQTYGQYTTPTAINRGWGSAAIDVHGEDTARIIFQNITRYTTTFCRLRMGLDLGKPIDYADNNLFGIKFIMT